MRYLIYGYTMERGQVTRLQLWHIPADKALGGAAYRKERILPSWLQIIPPTV